MELILANEQWWSHCYDALIVIIMINHCISWILTAWAPLNIRVIWDALAFNHLLARALFGSSYLWTPYCMCQALCWKVAEYAIPNMPLWHKNYWAKGSWRNSRYVKGTLTSAFLPENRRQNLWKMLSLYQEERFLSPEMGSWDQEKSAQTDLIKITHL